MGGAYKRLWEGHTGEEVSDLLDEGAQLLVAAVHALLGLVGLLQDVLSTQLGLVCLQLGLRHLDMSRENQTTTSLLLKVCQKHIYGITFLPFQLFFHSNQIF